VNPLRLEVDVGPVCAPNVRHWLPCVSSALDVYKLPGARLVGTGAFRLFTPSLEIKKTLIYTTTVSNYLYM